MIGGRRILLASTVALFVLISGCAVEHNEPFPPATSTRLNIAATWGSWEGSDVPHLLLTIRHLRGATVLVGRSGENVTITGPTGIIPLDWSSQSGAREIAPGDVIDVAFHPTVTPTGRLELSIDHASGPHIALPPGTYFACIGSDCGSARLG